jgi:hypothetical protein
MANYIPKIEYTHIVTGVETSFTFDSQPEGDPYNESIKPVVYETRSNNGTRQVQFNYGLLTYNLDFKFQSKATYDSVRDFLTEHAMRGGSFNYFPSSDESDYETWELDIKSVKFKRPIFDSVDVFLFDFSFSIERAIDNIIELDTGETGVGAISETSFTIVNNQAVPADIDGLAFELPDTRSIRAMYVDYTIYRNSTGVGAQELSEVGTIKGVWNSVETQWYMQKEALGDAGVTITISSTGQLQYTSTNMTGSVSVSVIRFKARTLSQEV